MSEGMSRTTGAIHVLHVDDDPEFADLAATFLEREDDRFDVETVTSAGEGLAQLEMSTYDCVISDHDMPGKNGIEFLENVREEYPELPFILYTGKGSEEVASDAISAGVTEYLQKEGGTSQYAVLANRIRNAVEKYYAQAELADREKRLNLFFEQSPLGVVEWDESFNFVRLNDAAERVLGFSEEELVGRSWDVIVPEADREPVDEVVSDLLENSGGYRSVNENVRKNGERIVCEWHNRVVTDDSGDVVAIFSQFRDITEEDERKAELQRSERRYEAVFDDPNILVGLLDTDGTVLDINETAMDYIDPALDEIRGEPFWETPWFDHSKDAQQEVKEWIDRTLDGEYVEFETDLVRPTGEPYTVEGAFRPVTNDDGAVVSLLISARDITERKERERDLQRHEAYLDESSDIITVLDAAGTITYQSPAVERILGYEPDELVDQPGFDFIHPDDVDRVYDTFTDLVAEPGETVTAECRFKTADDEWRWLEICGTNRLEHDAINGIVTNNRDITERKERQRELEQTNIVLSTLFETLPVGVLAEDTGRNVLAMNERIFDLFELPGSSKEVVGTDCERMAEQVSEMFVESEQFVKRINELVSGRESVRNEELSLQDGRTFTRDYEPLEFPEGDGHLWVYRDVTELKKREQALQRERDRLDEFASVVSHDLRNPLSVADGRLELAREECDSEHLASIETALDRIDRITEDMLWLAREGRDIGSIDAVVIRDAIDGAWNIVADHAEQAELHYADDGLSTVTVEADQNRLRQLLENLLGNAIEHGGEDVTVTVGTADGGFYVEDDGPGIPGDRREDVFTAGYSTDSDGTGFGLSTVKQIVEAHDWEIHVTEGSEGGARFEITGLTCVNSTQ